MTDDELRLRSHLLEEVVQGVIALDADRKVIYWNPAAERLFRWSKDEVLGRPIGDFLRSEQTAEQTAAIIAAIQKGESWTGDVNILRKDGSSFWGFVEDTPLYDAQGRFEGMLVVTVDITARVRAEREARELRQLLDLAHDTIVISDATTGQILDLTEGMVRATGYTREELLQRRLSELDENLATESKWNALRELLQKTGHHSTEGRLARKDGTKYPVEVDVQYIKDVDRIVAIIRDITEKKQNEEIEAARRENLHLKETDRTLRDFINAAAHDLSQPMTPIRLSLSLLGKSGETLPDPVRRSLAMLDRNVTRMTLMLQDLLDVARLESGTLSYEPAPTDLDELMRDTIETFKDQAADTGCSLTITACINQRVPADRRRIMQVLFNLVGNALKFTPDGGHITLQTCNQEDGVRVEVTDTGPGLTPEQISLLFKPFTQVHTEALSGPAGTGLGLYISKGIIEGHGGQIGVRSDGPGTGSTFWFTLPPADAGRASEPSSRP